MRGCLAFLAFPILLISGLLPAAAVAADDLRTVDFQSGFTIDQPARDGVEALPGVGLQVRWFGSSFWLAGAASFEASADLRNPERGELTTLVAIGGGAGVYVDLGERVTLFGGGRLEYVHGWDLPDATTAGAHDVDGLRAGPAASLALLLGRAWGHPMHLEARLSWLVYRLDADVAPASGWQGGMYLSGVLFPDRPLD